MPVHLLVYVGIVALVVLLPGPDTAVVTKNALLHGRAAGLGSAFGVNAGLSVWTLATAVGLTGLLRASGTAYDVLKLLGAAYLVWLMLSNFANPKIAIFFTSLLPQFVSTHRVALPQLLILGAVFIAINVVWMCGYALAAVRLSGALRRPRIKALIDRISGCALIGVGVWLVTDRR